MDVNGGAEGIRASKKLKTPEKEDRLSALPDCLIHHILSFLPSTKQAIRTDILSKRWRNQWTFVSNLIFNFSHMFSHAISRIVDRTLSLHQCPKIQRFQIRTDHFYDCERDPSCEGKIHFAVRKQAKELILKFPSRTLFRLPEFFFCQPSLVKLELFGCAFKPTGMVSWTSLKDLSIESCSCPCEVITSIVSGSPLLQSLRIKDRLNGPTRLVIASRPLKRLVVHHVNCYVDVSCPSLLEFDGSSLAFQNQNFGWCDKVLEKFLHDSPLLESLKLENFKFSNVRIALNILKRFVFKGRISNKIAILCPNLEELFLSGRLETLRLMDLSASVCAFLDSTCGERCTANVVKQILESDQLLNELKFRNNFLESLSSLEIDAMPHPLLKCKSLTLEGSHGFHILGIAYALRSSPVLERLVLKFQPSHKCLYLKDLPSSDHSEENYWKSNETRFSYLVSHLRTVKIVGFSQKQYKPNYVLDFLEFILKNARELEKMVVILEDYCQAAFVRKVSEKLFSFPRCSASVVQLVPSS